jgi:hypothetical protein
VSFFNLLLYVIQTVQAKLTSVIRHVCMYPGQRGQKRQWRDMLEGKKFRGTRQQQIEMQIEKLKEIGIGDDNGPYIFSRDNAPKVIRSSQVIDQPI